MKKIVFVLALFLAMNPLVSVADSSASAKSSNCTVNTCELTVTATPDPYGILLRWNFTEADYEVCINRDGAFVPKFIPAKNGFWRDTSAKYGVIHKYIISIGSMSKTIEATRGSGVAPTISKLEVAPLWLVNEGPYNVRVTISDHYDHNRYQIKGIYFTIPGKTKIWRDYNPSGVYNLYGFINSFILSCYGKYELIAQCEYKERVSGNEYVSKKGGKECEADVFVYFHKYGGTKKRPNWYENWKEDKLVDLDGFEYTYNLGIGVQGKYGGSGEREKVASLGYFQTFDGHYRNYPTIYKYKHKSGKLQIGPEAATESRDLPSLGVGKDGVGVVACAIVSTHEREHLATERDLYSGRYEYIFDMTLTKESIDALGKTIDLGGCDSNVEKYYSELCNYWKAKKEDALYRDSDHDGVRDAREADYGLTVGDRDTKKLHMLEWENAQMKDIYAVTGDDEYIARDAEKKNMAVI